jgi:hypothetical protein
MGNKKYAIQCLNGNHTFILHETEEIAIKDMKERPEKYINTEMISDNYNHYVHRGYQEGLTSFLGACIEMCEKSALIGSSCYEI